MIPRLWGGVVESSAGSGSQPSQPPAALPPGPPPAAAPDGPFPRLVFDDPVGPRTPEQLNFLAEATRTRFDLINRRLEEIDGKFGGAVAQLHGDTEGLRAQAGTIISNLQEQASNILTQMLTDQAEGRH